MARIAAVIHLFKHVGTRRRRTATTGICAWCKAEVPAADGLTMRDSRTGSEFVCLHCARG